MAARLEVALLYCPFVREPTSSPIMEVIPTGLRPKVAEEIKAVPATAPVCFFVRTLKGFGKYPDHAFRSGAKLYVFISCLVTCDRALLDRAINRSTSIGPMAIPRKKLMDKCFSRLVKLRASSP